MLTKPPTYSSLIKQHGLSVIAKGGDLVLTPDGDLMKTDDGDAQLGSIAQNGMFRLTQAWRLNSPSMRLMFDAVCELRDRHEALEKKANDALTPVLWNRRPFEAEVSAFHIANDELGAATLGRGALAGSLMVVTAALLLRFKHDVEPIGAEWQNTPPLTNAVSIGQMITAAANSFRHHDEWVRARFTNSFSTQQHRSLQPLMQALGLLGPDDLFGDVNASERIALLLGEQDFEQFEGTVLRYANAVAAKVEARSSPPL
jgi:hypothetical protein